MPQVKPVAKIHAAATYFVFVSRDPRQIADAFGVKQPQTIARWAETPEWAEVLDICGYTGDRTFQRQPTRALNSDGEDIFSQARTVYLAAVAGGVPSHKLAAVTAEKVGINSRRVRDWARKYRWRDEPQGR